jgi:hypothetical protein
MSAGYVYLVHPEYIDTSPPKPRYRAFPDVIKVGRTAWPDYRFADYGDKTDVFRCVAVDDMVDAEKNLLGTFREIFKTAIGREYFYADKSAACDLFDAVLAGDTGEIVGTHPSKSYFIPPDQRRVSTIAALNDLDLPVPKSAVKVVEMYANLTGDITPARKLRSMITSGGHGRFARLSAAPSWPVCRSLAAILRATVGITNPNQVLTCGYHLVFQTSTIKLGIGAAGIAYGPVKGGMSPIPADTSRARTAAAILMGFDGDRQSQALVAEIDSFI